jgi:hypothetical protein
MRFRSSEFAAGPWVQLKEPWSVAAPSMTIVLAWAIHARSSIQTGTPAAAKGIDPARLPAGRSPICEQPKHGPRAPWRGSAPQQSRSPSQPIATFCTRRIGKRSHCERSRNQQHDFIVGSNARVFSFPTRVKEAPRVKESWCACGGLLTIGSKLRPLYC